MGTYNKDEEAQGAQADEAQHGVVAHGTFSPVATLVPRLATSIFCILALTFLVTSKQTKQLGIMSIEATWMDTKSFFLLAVLNAICLGYSLLQVTISVVSTMVGKFWLRSKTLAWTTFAFDQVLTYLLLANAGASSEVSYIAKHGELKPGWTQVCSTFNSFCNRLGLSLVLSFLAVLTLAMNSLMTGFTAVVLHVSTPNQGKA